MTVPVSPDCVPAPARVTATGRHATTQGAACSHLHNAFGPGCPWCMPAAGTAQAVPFWLPGGAR